MGRQINFFMMPDDIRELDKKIHEMGLVVVETTAPTTAPVQIESILSGKVNKKLVVNPTHIKLLKYAFCEEQNHYRIDITDSPTIEISRSNYDKQQNTLREGRLYYTTETYCEGKRIEKSIDFVKCAESLFRWTRRNFTNAKINPLLTTHRTIEWKKNTQGRLLTSYGAEL